MKIRSVLLSLLFLTSILVPLRAEAGCCNISVTTPNKCFTDAELIAPAGEPPPGGWTQDKICASYAGVYATSCTCPTVAAATTQCCVLFNGMCEQPTASGACTTAFSSPSTLPCTALSCRSEQAQPAPVGIAFKPQLTLPGSKFIAGESIIITGNTLGEYIAALYVFMVGAIGILATVMTMYGGLRWVLAAGDRGKIQEAKETISSAIIGVILALSAYLLLLTISPKLVKFTSLTLKPVKPIEQVFAEGEVSDGARGAAIGAATLTRDWLDGTTGVRTQYGSLITSLQNSQVPADMIYA
ncbi:MAG: pilin, partial [Patescibacteria group bacterium]